MGSRTKKLGYEDWEVLKKLRTKAIVSDSSLFPWPARPDGLLTEAEWRQRLVSAVWVGTWMEGRAVGLTCARKDAVSSDHERELESVWVEKQYRKNGITRDMVDALAEWARKEGVTQLNLWVLRDNVDAQLVYRALGFTPTGEEKPMEDGSGRVETRWRRMIGLVPKRPGRRPVPG